MRCLWDLRATSLWGSAGVIFVASKRLRPLKSQSLSRFRSAAIFYQTDELSIAVLCRRLAFGPGGFHMRGQLSASLSFILCQGFPVQSEGSRNDVIFMVPSKPSHSVVSEEVCTGAWRSLLLTGWWGHSWSPPWPQEKRSPSLGQEWAEKRNHIPFVSCSGCTPFSWGAEKSLT